MSTSPKNGPGRRKRAGVAALLAALVTLAMLPMYSRPALSAVKGDRGIEVFYGISFVLIRDYPPNTDVLVEVVRGENNVVVGRQTVRTDGDGFYEINHVGGGQPPAGDCWEVTPQILPGDTVRTTIVADPTDVDTTAVRDVFIDLDAIAFDESAGTITVQGHAKSSTAAPIVPGTDVLEFRMNKAPGSGVWSVNGRKDLREDVGADVDPVTGAFTHVFEGLSAADVASARDSGVDQIIEWSQAVGEAATPEITVFDGFGAQLGDCPPLAEYAVTSSNPPSINRLTGTRDVVLSGTSTDATAVSATLSDGTNTTAPVSATITPATGSQTWSATIPQASVAALNDGTLTAAGSYTTSGGTIGGVNLSVLKDLVAPAAPTATPRGGTYSTAQSVTLSNPTETTLPIHFTVDGTAPDALDPRYTTQIQVTASQTIKAVAIDAAGNPSPVSTNTYTIGGGGAPTITSAPTQTVPLNATLGTSNVPVRISWAASDPQGIASYNLQQSTDGGAFVNVSLPSPTARAVTKQLAPGRTYRFQVRATDGAGNTGNFVAGAARTLSAIQQSSAQVTYVNTWTNINDTGFYGGSARAASLANRTATLSFTGTSVGWVATKAPNRGRAQVSIDGRPPVTVDLYSSGTAKRKLVFAANNLAPGPHTLKVTVLGTKNPSATGTQVDVDAFEVLAP